MFDLGMQELIVIFIVALLVFGPKKLPELGKTIGKGIAELKRAMQNVKEQIDSEVDISASKGTIEDVKPELSKEEKTDEVKGSPDQTVQRESTKERDKND